MERSTQSRKIQQKILSILLLTLWSRVDNNNITPSSTAFVVYDYTGLHLNIRSFNSLTVDFCTPPTY